MERHRRTHECDQLGIPATHKTVRRGGIDLLRLQVLLELAWAPFWPAGAQVLGRRFATGPRSALTAVGVAALPLVMDTLSLGLGQFDASGMAATAGVLLGGTDRVGLLFTAIAGGSVTGWFDLRRAQLAG